MTHASFVVPFLLLASTVAAQEPLENYYALYPDYAVPENCTQFTTRSELGQGAGEILQAGLGWITFGFGDYNRGGGTTGYITTFHARIQDQNEATREQIRFVLRKADQTGTSPDATAGGLVYRSQLLPHRGNGAVDISFALGTPVSFAQNVQHFFGVWLPAAPNWPADGLSQWYADDQQGTLGDHPRDGAPGHIYVVQGTDLPGPTRDRGSLRAALTTRAPVVRTGGKDPANTRQLPAGSTNFGRGGTWPKVSPSSDGTRFDDLAIECQARGQIGGALAAAIGLGHGAPLALPFQTDGGLRLTSPLWLPPLPIPASGKVQVDLPLGPPDAPVRQSLATLDLYVQFVAVSTQSLVSFSNVAVWRTRP